MKTPISNIPTGSWFEYHGERFIKTVPFLSFSTTYQAVSLVDGRPAFMMRTRSTDHPSIGTEEVEVIDKLDWAISVTGQLRYETDAERHTALVSLSEQVTGIRRLDCTEDGPYFIIDYQTTEERHLRIQSLFGAG